ncbi:MAG: hypothetical protein ACREBG_12935 [Pyrinomonadaceae bacterium]
MSYKNLSGTRKMFVRAPAGTLSLDRTGALSNMQAQRPPARDGSNRGCPVILLAENREPLRVAF